MTPPNDFNASTAFHKLIYALHVNSIWLTLVASYFKILRTQWLRRDLWWTNKSRQNNMSLTY